MKKNKNVLLKMANNNDMITLNIYNQPPPKSVDETGMNINQTEQDLNLNTDKPQMNPVFYDNVRNDQQNNYNSAPRGNINNKGKILQIQQMKAVIQVRLIPTMIKIKFPLLKTFNINSLYNLFINKSITSLIQLGPQ